MQKLILSAHSVLSECLIFQPMDHISPAIRKAQGSKLNAARDM